MLLVLPDPDGHIWADLCADGATRARTILIPDDEKVSLTVNLVSDSYDLLWTGDGAECAALTTLTIDFDFGSHKKPIGMMEYWNSGILGTK